MTSSCIGNVSSRETGAMRVREKMGGRKRERVGMCIWNFWLDRTPESRREKKKKNWKGESILAHPLARRRRLNWIGAIRRNPTAWSRPVPSDFLRSLLHFARVFTRSTSTLHVHPHTESPDYRPIPYSSSYTHPLSLSSCVASRHVFTYMQPCVREITRQPSPNFSS